MVGVTTVALLERRPDISRSLFSRYWRDVHGVMAARIPGFESYTQYHVTPLADVGSREPGPFEGIAVVTFTDEKDREGLVHSEITKHIHRDEQNVFRRVFLYNLAPGASVTVFDGDQAGNASGYFVVVPADSPVSTQELSSMLWAEGALTVRMHDLTSGDPSAWSSTATEAGSGSSPRFVGVVHAEWQDSRRAVSGIGRCVAASRGRVTAYRIDETHVMVEGGRPTQVGLRGLDAVRTIHEAGAVNQLDEAVIRAIYGDLGKVRTAQAGR